MFRALIPVVAVVFAGPVHAGWLCSNPIEIRCSSDTCSVEPDFTSMGISYAPGGDFEVCLYSLCATDPAPVTVQVGNLTTVMGDGLLNAAAPDSPAETAALTVGTDGVGSLVAFGFVVPVICTKSD